MHLLFNPKKLLKLEAPFSFYKTEKSEKEIKVHYKDCTAETLTILYKGETLKTLSLFSIKEVDKQKKQITANYYKVSLTTSETDYLDKYLGHYFFDSFRKVLPFMLEAKPYHRIQNTQNSFTNLSCTFNTTVQPQLSFKLGLENKKILIHTFININDVIFKAEKVKRFRFLLLVENTYYILKKSDWLLLDDIDEVGELTHGEFIATLYKKLKAYPLDVSGVFREEIRDVKPHTTIQVSELGGNMLRWDYNGYTVDDHKASFEVYEDDKKIIYRRNREIEIQTLQFLQEAHPKFKGQSNFYLSFEEASKKNWFFNFYHEKLKDGFSVVGMDMLGYFRYSPHPIETEFQILKTDDNNVSAILKTYFGKEKVSIKTLQKALNEGKKFVLLKDSSLGILTDQWLEQFGLILKYADADQDTIIFSKWILIVSEAKSEHQEHLRMVLTEDWLHKWQTWQQSDDILYPVPQNLKATLRNYQQKGYEWINLMAEINAGTLLADDMGLGKTLQTIASVVYWQEQNPRQKVLVVCPASLVYNWKIEFKKFAPSLKLAVYHNATRDFAAFVEGEETVLISSYSIIRNDIDLFTKMIWDAVVLDESHHIKNYKTKQTQAILSLLAKKRIILNGTPIMNNVSDLFPQLHFLLPQLFNSRKKFRDEFENPIHQALAQNPMEQLRKLTNPFVLRRTKEIAAPDLPKKTESILWCEMSDDQRSIYETLKAQIKQNIFMEINHKGLNKAKLGVLQGITKLRQVCSSPRLLKDFDGVQKAASIKIDQLIESLTTNLKNEKVIVFTQFLGTMELISKQLTKKGIEYLSFNGSTMAEKRMELVSEFQDENSSARVFLLSLMAGNSGINLTRANYVFLVEPWWNKAVQQQAIDRVHRIGQDRHVFAYTMICKDTIEEKIIVLQDKKQFISDEIIANEENFVKNLNEEDITFLFE